MPGILMLAGMGLQFPPGAITISIGEDGQPKMEVKETLVRLDLWPTWLEIGCVHAEQARAANAELSPDLLDVDKTKSIEEELQAGLVAMTAFAFAFDGFYDTVRNELGSHPDQAAWKKNRTARPAQISDTLKLRLKLGPKFSGDLRLILGQLLEFRDRAVHPNSKFVPPNYRPQIDSGVHPHLITFSGPHAVQARALILGLLGRLIERARELARSDADLGWIDRGEKEVARLASVYRVPGDDQLAFPPPPEDAQ